jgi:ribosomal-protein-serine acetyltransferase
MFQCKISEDIEIRQLEESDAAVLFALIDRNRAHLGPWLSSQELCETLEDARSFIYFSLERYEHNGAFDAGVWDKGHLCGVVALHTINWEKCQSDIGYWLGAEFQGRGLMITAVRAVVNYAFDRCRLKRVTINCAVNNLKSRAIPERLGFKLERIKPEGESVDEQLADRAVYGMFDWKWRGEPHPLLARRLAAAGGSFNSEPKTR